jgi:hypothetical protein
MCSFVRFGVQVKIESQIFSLSFSELLAGDLTANGECHEVDHAVWVAFVDREVERVKRVQQEVNYRLVHQRTLGIIWDYF